MVRIQPWCRLVFFCSLFLLAASGSGRENPDKFFSYLQEIFNRHNKNLHSFLLAELNQYIVNFPASEKAPEAQFLIAKVYQEKGNKPQAVAAFLKTIYLYPGSNWQQEAASAARKMITDEGAFKEQRAKLLALVEATPKGQTPADRYFEYLLAVKGVEYADAYGVVVDDARKFLILFPEATRQDTTIQMMAELYAKNGEKHEAEACYLRLEYCCAESPLLPYARYSRGVLLSKELGEHKMAIDALNDLVSKSPASEYATLAIFKMGEIKKEKLKDFGGAIANYRRFVETSIDSARTVDALWAIAEINTDNTKDYGNAIAAYTEIVEKHKGDKRAATAFEKIGDVFKDKLADYNKAAEQYAKMIEAFPYNEKAPALAIKAGDLCEDKLKDYQRALEYYRLVIDKFPQSKIADEARKKFEKARVKAAK